MSVVGAFCTVWRESRYLPLVLEQLVRVPGPTVIIHNELPFFWECGGEPPRGSDSRVPEILAQFPTLKVVRPETHLSTETILRNYATKYLLEQGATVALWQDSDFIIDLSEFDRLVGEMAAYDPCCWSVSARHYWRNWNTTYATGGVRMGYPTGATWNDGSFEPEFENNARTSDVMIYHPSYVLNGEEIYAKINAFFHAPYFRENHFWEKWQSGAADREQDLKPADLILPIGIQHRLAKWNCAIG